MCRVQNVKYCLYFDFNGPTFLHQLVKVAYFQRKYPNSHFIQFFFPANHEAQTRKWEENMKSRPQLDILLDMFDLKKKKIIKSCM